MNPSTRPDIAPLSATTPQSVRHERAAISFMVLTSAELLLHGRWDPDYYLAQKEAVESGQLSCIEQRMSPQQAEKLFSKLPPQAREAAQRLRADGNSTRAASTMPELCLSLALLSDPSIEAHLRESARGMLRTAREIKRLRPQPEAQATPAPQKAPRPR